MDAKVQIIAVGVVSALAGAAVGSLVTKTILEKRAEERIEDEIQAARRFYAQKPDIFEVEVTREETEVTLVSEDQKDDLTDGNLKDTIAEALSKYGGHSIADDNVVRTRNIFDEENDAYSVRDFDYQKELPRRSPDAPYVISEEEFNENELNLVHTNLTWYADDKVLIDDDEEVYEDTDKTVGDFNLTLFGYGTNSSSVVFVRNEKMGVEFEIFLHAGSYSELVLGLDPEV